MKTRLTIALVLMVSLILALAPASTRARPAVPRETEPPKPQGVWPEASDIPGDACERTPKDQWVAQEEPVPFRDTGELAPRDTGGPDDYGYTWDDSVAFNWIDATAGTNTGLEGVDDYTAAIDIGFNFQFYKNTYSQLYITTNGLVTFGEGAYHY